VNNIMCIDIDSVEYFFGYKITEEVIGNVNVFCA
jgi:hypothetical protein